MVVVFKCSTTKINQFDKGLVDVHVRCIVGGIADGVVTVEIAEMVVVVVCIHHANVRRFKQYVFQF